MDPKTGPYEHAAAIEPLVQNSTEVHSPTQTPWQSAALIQERTSRGRKLASAPSIKFGPVALGQGARIPPVESLWVERQGFARSESFGRRNNVRGTATSASPRRGLLSVLVIAILVALLCGCGDEPKGKKKKRGRSSEAPTPTQRFTAPVGSTVRV